MLSQANDISLERMHLLKQKCKPSENVEVADNTYIIDGNAYFQVRLPGTFEGLAYALFDSLLKTKVVPSPILAKLKPSKDWNAIVVVL